MNRFLSKEFFARPAKDVARDLVGTHLIRKREGGAVVRKMITETEAYVGPEDQACHARFGKTNRTAVMYGEPGTMYVYLIYGMYDMLNIVTDEQGHPAAVLIRGIEGHDGPGKLTRFLDITKAEQNGQLLGEEAGVWVESRTEDFSVGEIATTPRVGIDYATGGWKDELLRFVIESE